MILGIGTDLVAIARIAGVLARHGDRFARRILAAGEYETYRTHPSPARFLAKRFAVKEAAAKALGTGIRGSVTFQAISLEHDELGAPRLRFSNLLAEELAKKGVSRHHVSVSDEKGMAVAFVILETS